MHNSTHMITASMAHYGWYTDTEHCCSLQFRQPQALASSHLGEPHGDPGGWGPPDPVVRVIPTTAMLMVVTTCTYTAVEVAQRSHDSSKSRVQEAPALRTMIHRPLQKWT